MSGSRWLTAGTQRVEMGRGVRKLGYQASHPFFLFTNECQFGEGSVPDAVEMHRCVQHGRETREVDG